MKPATSLLKIAQGRKSRNLVRNFQSRKSHDKKPHPKGKGFVRFSLFPFIHGRFSQGQLFTFPVIVVAFFALLFVHILTYFLFSLSGLSDVTASATNTFQVVGQPTNPFISITHSTYLRTPIPDSMSKTPGMDTQLKTFLDDHQDLWKERTYGEFLTLLTSAHYQDPPTIATVFPAVTTALFSSQPPSGKRFSLTTGNQQPYIVDVGNILELERQLRDLRTSQEAYSLDDSLIADYQKAKDYESFKAQHTSTHTIASLAPEQATISLYILIQDEVKLPP